ncbi:MAG TPA: hypothetical protein VGO79_01805 [Thermoanaerobaculia bacterium]
MVWVRGTKAVSVEIVKSRDLKSLIDKDPFEILGLRRAKEATLEIEEDEKYRTED